MNWLVGIHSQQCRLGTYGRPGKNYGTVTDSFFFTTLGIPLNVIGLEMP